MFNDSESRLTLLGWLDGRQQTSGADLDGPPPGLPSGTDPITKSRGESPEQLSVPRREGPETKNRGESPAGMRHSGQRREGPHTAVRDEFQ